MGILHGDAEAEALLRELGARQHPSANLIQTVTPLMSGHARADAVTVAGLIEEVWRLRAQLANDPQGSGEVSPASMPVQTMKLADDLFPAIFRGQKRCTVRAGLRDIVPGPLRFESASGAPLAADVEVRRVSYSKAINLRPADARGGGCRELGDLLRLLSRFYPELCPDDPVTIVEFVLCCQTHT